MGQKCNPISNRLGIIKGWDSNWFGERGGKKYATWLEEDAKIRKYLNARLSNASVAKIIIERTIKMITITINTSRPGFVIGKSGEEVEKLRAELKKITNKEIQINIFEIKRAELEAQLVANDLKKKIEGKMQYRKAVKMAIAATMRSKAEGIKVQISGRLNGAEMARSEMYKEGRTPLHTLRADIDYALAEALTKTGLLGIKVWICRGEIYGKKDLSPNVGASFDKKTYSNQGFDRGVQRDRNDRSERYDKRERGERTDRGERNERGERGDRPFKKRKDNPKK